MSQTPGGCRRPVSLLASCLLGACASPGGPADGADTPDMRTLVQQHGDPEASQWQAPAGESVGDARQRLLSQPLDADAAQRLALLNNPALEAALAMVQMAMGLMGLWVTHPRQRHPHIAKVDRDFCFLMAAYNIEPGSMTPQVSTMLDFNLWTWNSRVFPGIDSLNVRQGDRVRIRVGKLTMSNHPLHLHGHEFTVTGTDGGPVPPSARWPEVSTDVAVGQVRQIEFVADEEGDWSLHCHKSHHTMGPMGHAVPTMIGVDHACRAVQDPEAGARLHAHGRPGHGREWTGPLSEPIRAHGSPQAAPAPDAHGAMHHPGHAHGQPPGASGDHVGHGTQAIEPPASAAPAAPAAPEPGLPSVRKPAAGSHVH